MLMPASKDLLESAYCAESGVNLVWVDVTDSARALERSHLSGPTAGLALANALAAVALLANDLSEKDETVSFRQSFDGPLMGLLVEASKDGSLRGYTRVKVMNDFDGRDPIPLDEALGSRASVQIIRSVPGSIIERSSFESVPASAQAALRAYMNSSQQRKSLSIISCESYNGYIERARGILAELMPDGDRLAFERLRARFGDGSALEALDSAGGLAAWASELRAGELSRPHSLPMRFACRCSRERAEATLSTLSPEERRAMAREKPTVTIYCHMCGASYEIPLIASGDAGETAK